jgi:hypothetical protein
VSVEEAWIVPPEDPSAQLLREQVARLEQEVGRLASALERIAAVATTTARTQVEMRADLLAAGAFERKSSIIMPGDRQ